METTNFLMMSGIIAVLSFMASMVVFSIPTGFSNVKSNTGILVLFFKASGIAILKKVLTIITAIASFLFILKLITLI